MNNNIEENSTSTKIICLNNLSSIVLSIIRNKQISTFNEIADLVISSQNLFNDNLIQTTIRRKIYDILNILLATGIIQKENKQIFFKPLQPFQIPESEIPLLQKCEYLQNILITKIKTLILYRALIERNQNLPKSNNIIQLPAIFLGLNDISSNINRNLDGKKLEIIGKNSPMFFSPNDILEKINLPLQKQKEIIFKKSPILSKLEPFIIPNVYEESDFNCDE